MHGPAGRRREPRGRAGVVRGDALLGLRRYDEARASFESVLKAQPENLNALQGLAAAAFGAGGIEAARTVFARRPEQVRRRPRYWLALGSLELRASALEEAEKAFEDRARRAHRTTRKARTLSRRSRV